MALAFKTFPWADVSFDECDTIEGDVRLYQTPDGDFPSMTSLLKQLDDGGVAAWEKRVGPKEAERIRTASTTRGNALHDYNEKYLQNTLTRSELQGQARTLFNRVKRYLDEIELVVATEVPLWSKTHRYAGRVDCIGMLHNKIMIIDHKNSRKPIDLTKKYACKKLFKYQLQCCGYARALKEMKGIEATDGCLIVGNHETSTADRFIFPLQPLERELDIVIEAYHNPDQATEILKQSLYFQF